MIIEIRKTGMGAVTLPIPIDSTVRIRLAWGRTHGQAQVSGYGKFLLKNVSNRGNHNCSIILLKQDGSSETLEAVSGQKICPLCDRYDR